MLEFTSETIPCMTFNPSCIFCRVEEAVPRRPIRPPPRDEGQFVWILTLTHALFYLNSKSCCSKYQIKPHVLIFFYLF